MAEQTLETLVLKLVADSEGLRGDLQKALSTVEKSAKGMQDSLGGINSTMNVLKGAALSLAAAIGTTLSVGAFGSMIAKSMEAMDVQAKLADRLDLTTDEFAALNLAADLAGTSVEAVAQSSNFLRKAITAAREGNEDMIRNFDALGLSAEKLAGMRIDESIGLIADRLYTMKDASARTSLALEVLGKGAGQLDAFLRDGSEGIAEARRQIEAMGGAVSRLDMARVEEANDAWTSMQAIITRVKDELAVQLAPAFTLVLKESANFTTKFVKDMGGVKKVTSDALVDTLTFADGWVRTSQTIGGFLANLVKLFKASWDVILSSGEFVWRSLEKSFTDFIYVTTHGLSDLFHESAKLARSLGQEGLGNAFDEAAISVVKNTGVMKDAADKAFDESVKKGTQAAKDLGNAFMNILSVDNSGSKQLQDLIAKTQQFATEMQKETSKGTDTSGGAQNSPAVQKFREEQALKLEELRKSLLTERELEIKAFQEKTGFLNSLKEEQFQVEGERNVLLQELEAQHQSKITEIDQKANEARKKIAQQTLKAQLDGASTFFSNMSSLMNTNSKRLFAIGKAAAMATTIVNTASAAMAAYNYGAQQGGPYLGAAYAAAAIAAGAVQLANISSASPGGGGGVGGGGMGVPATTGSDPNSPNVGVRQPGMAQDLNIIVQGGSLVSTDALLQVSEEYNRLRGQGIVIGNVNIVQGQ